MNNSKVFSGLILCLIILGICSCSSPVAPSTSTGGVSVVSYSVYYHANGGSGAAPATETKNEGQEVTIKDQGSLAKAEWNFLHWNTRDDDLGTSYQFGQKFNISANLNLYAIWTQNIVVQYYNNEAFADTAVSGVVPAAEAYPEGSSVTIAGNTGNLARPEYTFEGWNTQADGLGDNIDPDVSLIVNASTYPAGRLSLYAKWAPKPDHAFSYDGNNKTSGTVPAGGGRYREDAVITVLGNTGSLTRTGYLFNNWNTKADGTGTNYVQGNKITMATSDITLYAEWKKLYSLTYDKNGATSGTAPGTVESLVGAKITIPSIGNLVKTDHYFKGWNTKADGTGTFYYPGDEYTVTANNIVLYAIWIEGRFFNARTATNNTWYVVAAKKLATGANCIIYADETINFSSTDALEIRDEYESKIHQKMIDSFGTFKDVDNNGKVIILLLDIIDGYSGGSYVAGYFDPTHMFSTGTYAKSNQADMLFVDINPGWTEKDLLYTTIAHEFQHLISFSKSLERSPPNVTEQDIWINEGLSSAAEFIYGDFQQGRLDSFNYSTSIILGNNFFVWDGFWENPNQLLAVDEISNYSTVYLFFQWLRVHSTNGTQIYKDIINSSYTNYRAVTAAAAARIDSQFSNWTTLLSTWMLANIQVNDSGYEGYNGDPDLKPEWMPINYFFTYYVRSASPVRNEFAPGEGILSIRNSQTFNRPYDTYIKYYNSTNRPNFYKSGTYEAWLTVNVDTNWEAEIFRFGNLATSVENSPSFSNNIRTPIQNFQQQFAAAGPYPVSFEEKLKENEMGTENKKSPNLDNLKGKGEILKK